MKLASTTVARSLLWILLRTKSVVRSRFERIRETVLDFSLRFVRIRNLNRFEHKIYSQNGEDGMIQAIFKKIGTTNRFCVEFGCEDARECNTRYLLDKKGWFGLLMDSSQHNGSHVRQEFVTAENINILFKKYKVPFQFDLLSIDIDGNDYWVWKALELYSPRVVVIEYNAKFPPPEAKAIRYQPDFRWDGSDYFGATLGALVKLAATKGYTLVGCDAKGVNAFFIRNDEFKGRFVPQPIDVLYRAPLYGSASDNGGWPTGRTPMEPV